MAWSLVGIAPAAASAPVESTTTSITLSEPAGVAANDLLVAIISYRAASTTSVVLPANWLLVEEQKTNDVVAVGAGAIASGVMAYTVRGAVGSGGVSPFTTDFSADFGGGGAIASYVFALPSGISVALGRIIAYRNTDVPRLGTHSSTTLATGATAVVAAGLTTTLANDLVVVGMCGATNITNTTFDAVTDPTTSSGTNSAQVAAPIAGTWQERADDGTSSGADCGLAIADAVRSTAGATGNITCTASASARHVVLVASFVNVTTSVSNIHPGLTAWSSGSKTLGQRVSNAGNAYECILAGTSTTAPTGTSADSAPGGTAHWKWLSAINYTSQSAWNTAMPAALVSDLAAYIWNNGEVVLTSGRIFEYYGHTAGIFRTLITAAPGESFRDKPLAALTYTPSSGVSYRQTSVNTDICVYIDVANTTIEGIQTKSDNATNAQGYNANTNGINLTVSNCLIRGYALPGDLPIVYSASVNTRLFNCVIIDDQPASALQSEAIKFDLSPCTGVVDSCIIIAVNGASPNGVAIKSLSGASTVIVRNTAMFGYPIPLLAQNVAGSIVFDHCIMDAPLSATQATGGVTWGSANIGGSLFSKIAANQFISATADFRPKAGADIINVGVGDAASLDLYRVARGPLPDIGPIEFVPTAVLTSIAARGTAGAFSRAIPTPLSAMNARGTSGSLAALLLVSPPTLSVMGVSAATGRLAVSTTVALPARGVSGSGAQGLISGGAPEAGFAGRGIAGSSGSLLAAPLVGLSGSAFARIRGVTAMGVRANIAARGTAGSSGRATFRQSVVAAGIAAGSSTVIGGGTSASAATMADILFRLSPDFEMQEKPRLLTAPFGDGYQQVTPDGLTAIQRTLTLGWQNTDKAEIDRLVAFFRARVGKTISFVAPRDTAPRQWIVISLHRTFPHPNADSLSVTLEERLFVDRSLIPGVGGFDIIGEGELV